MAAFDRGVAEYFLEGRSKPLKMSATVVGQRRKFWVSEQLKW